MVLSTPAVWRIAIIQRTRVLLTVAAAGMAILWPLPAAAEVAAKNGLKGSEPSMSVLRTSGAPASGTRWLVTGGFQAGDTTITLNAATGAFIMRSVID